MVLLPTLLIIDGTITWVILGLLVFISITFITNYYNKKNRILRKLKTFEARKPLLTKDNEYTKMIGTAAILDQSLTSPIGNRKCVYYQVKIQQQVGGKRRYWKTISTEEKGQNFILKVGDQHVIIEATIPKSHKKIYLKTDLKRRSGKWNNAPSPHLEKYLHAKNQKSRGVFGLYKTLRYYEAVIAVDEKLAVLGTTIRKKTDQQWDRYSSETLFLSGDAKRTLVITDDPKAFTAKK